MNPGDTEPLPAQEVSLDKVQMDFKITQDGTLKKGDVLQLNWKIMPMALIMPTLVLEQQNVSRVLEQLNLCTQIPIILPMKLP